MLWNSIRSAAPKSAIVPGCSPSGPAATKAAMTPAMTNSEVRISGGSVIMPRSSSAMTRARASGVARISRPQIRCVANSCAAMTRMMTGVSAKTKSLKLRCAAEPVMMLGGSPISVALPPILEANTSATRNGYGGGPRRQHRQRRPGLGAALFGRPHGHMLEHAAAPRDGDEHHHAGQERDRVEIDAADRLVLAQHTRDDHRARSKHRDNGAVDTLGDDEEIGEHEQDRRHPHRLASRERRCGGDLLHARSFLLPIVPPGRNQKGRPQWR